MFVGLVCGELLFVLLLRTLTARLPLSATWKGRVWRWGIALAVVYGLMLLIVMLTMDGTG